MAATPPLPRPINLDEFLPFVGRMLSADCDPRPVALELREATPLLNSARLERAPFILILRSAPDALLVSATYVVRGDGFGPDLIDLIQIARPVEAPAGHYYQAVFN